MCDRLTLKQTDPDGSGFSTLYDHPELGKIKVGAISRRTSVNSATAAWSWSVLTNLDPVYSPDHGQVPNENRTRVRRQSAHFEGTAASMDDAGAQWKAHWLQLRDARSEAEWQQIKEDQNRSQKQILRYDCLKIEARLRPDQQAAIEAELAAAGPAPQWLLDLIPSSDT